MARDVQPGTPAPSERPCGRAGDVVDFAGQRVASGPCVDGSGGRIEHTAYVFPSRGTRAVWLSSIAAAVLAIVLPALFFVGRPVRSGEAASGLRTALSPGPTTNAHSLAVLDCAQCHRRQHDVEDVRCERCHDPAISARLSNAAHVFQGTHDLRGALAAPAVACTQCHVEHRGAGMKLAAVDSRECGACHTAHPPSQTPLAAFDVHPEFAIVRAGVESGNGLRWFNHKLHLPKVAAKYQKTCDACHDRAPGAAAFTPISFPRHCADCHERDLAEPRSIPASALTRLGPLAASLTTSADLDDPARRRINGVRHADPWVLRTVQALRVVVDPDGSAAERVTLDAQAAQIELSMAYGRPAVGAGAWTGPSNVATASGASSDAPAVGQSAEGTAAAVEAFVAQAGLDGLQGSGTDGVRNAAQELRAAAGSVAPPVPPAPHDPVEPLLRLVDATIARAQQAGDAGLAERATALRGRLAALPRKPRQGSDDAGSTRVVESLLSALAAVRDPGVQADLARLTYLAGFAQPRTGSTITPEAFDLHRQRTLKLLDAVAQTVAGRDRSSARDPDRDRLLARVTALRQRVLATSYGLAADVAAARRRFFDARQADRGRVDTELDAAGLLTPAPAEPSRRVPPWQRELEHLQVRLTAIATAQRVTGISPQDARLALASLMGSPAASAAENLSANRCAYCHDMEPGGLQLAPMGAVGASLLVNAAFDHQPHTTADGRNCETCHTTIAQSTSPRDVNLPGVDSCRTCHAPGRQAAASVTCQSCHSYHAPSRAALTWTP
jgi:hypothetical protein